MKYLPHSLVLCFGVLAVTGCPGGDDDDDSSDAEHGDSDGGIDEGAVAGKGAAGKGGSAAGNGASDGGRGGISADEAAMGVCEMMGEMGAAGAGANTQCTGIEDYTKCADETCGSGDCYDGDCKELLDCYQDAADPCKADCKPSSACNACLSQVAQCATDECLPLLMCGETEAGGACDELDECCEARTDSAKTACESAAEAARSGGGDELCNTVLTSLCPE